MTLDKLLKIPSQEWDTLGDSALTALLQPYFVVTRPNPAAVAAKKEAKKAKASRATASKSMVDDLLRLAREHGLNIPPPSKSYVQ